MFDFLTVCRALSDENRARILMALRGRRLCVCQITAFLDLAPSTTSKHLSLLRQARLIEGRKEGRWVYYYLAESARTPAFVREALDWMRGTLAAAPAIAADEARIADILRAEAACGFTEDGEACFHSPEIHSLDPLAGTAAGNRENGETPQPLEEARHD